MALEEGANFPFLRGYSGIYPMGPIKIANNVSRVAALVVSEFPLLIGNPPV